VYIRRVTKEGKEHQVDHLRKINTPHSLLQFSSRF
jgi:hypothetical protein